MRVVSAHHHLIHFAAATADIHIACGGMLHAYSLQVIVFGCRGSCVGSYIADAGKVETCHVELEIAAEIHVFGLCLRRIS